MKNIECHGVHNKDTTFFVNLYVFFVNLDKGKT
jgi:hypothetical protein